MRGLVVVIALCVFPSLCFAEPTVMHIPKQGWKISFDAPTVAKVKERNSATQYYFLGNSDRFNLSLTVETPGCPGELLDDNYNCIRRKIDNNPIVVRQSISVKKRPTNIQVSYIMYAKVGDRAVKHMNTHVLFVHKARWGDLHASVVQPTIPEIAMLLGLGDRFASSDSP